MQITSASFAYPRLDGEIRADLAARLSVQAVPGTMVLSTCLRIEVAAPGGEDALQRVLSEVFATGEVAPLIALGQVRTDLEAVTHLFRVAAGLESPFIGEREILSQFRQAVVRAGDALGEGLFQKLLEGAVATGRQVREEILTDSPHASMAAVTAQAVGAAQKVAVIGAGTMATSVAHALLALPAPPDVVIAARRPEKVAVPGATVCDMDRLEDLLAELPAVVSVTSAGRQLLSANRLAAIASARVDPLLLVDLAMPPDFRPPPTPGLIYYDVDRLAAMAVRRIPSDEADAFVGAAAAGAYRRVVDHPELGP
ncbi:MAG: hypothetical protein Q8Q52_02760, partial [Acidimicrobiia bacterium]|nr:hypothetical protein [Acidimicrobiia bacterium]